MPPQDSQLARLEERINSIFESINELKQMWASKADMCLVHAQTIAELKKDNQNNKDNIVSLWKENSKTQARVLAFLVGIVVAAIGIIVTLIVALVQQTVK